MQRIVQSSIGVYISNQRQLILTGFPDRPLHAPESDPIANETAIQHFHDKLLHIREQLKTEPGKQLAEKRHQYVRSYTPQMIVSTDNCS